MVDRIEAASVGELSEGEMRTVKAGERTILLINVTGALLAIDDTCPHSGCSLSDGTLEGDELECICHGSVFDVRTGEVHQGPAEDPVPTYPVHLEGETIYVEVDQASKR